MIVSRLYTADLLSYEPTYESGIEWRSVGGIWKALDRGSIISRWSSIIVMRGTADNIANIRASIFSWKKSGDATFFTFQNHEPVFGPELSYSSEFTCLCEEADEPYVVDVGENEFISTWTVAIYPIGDLTSRYVSNPSIPSEGMFIQAVTRLGNIEYKLHEMESSRKGSGFEFDTPTVEVSYISTRNICADSLC